MVSSSNGLGHVPFPPEADPSPKGTELYMYYLYILKSSIKNWHYIGITKDLQNRLAEHNSGEVKSTRAYRPFKIVYVEKFSSKTEARKREIFIKKNSKARREVLKSNMVPSSSLV